MTNAVRFGLLHPISQVDARAYEKLVASNAERYNRHADGQLALLEDPEEQARVEKAVATARLLTDFYATVDTVRGRGTFDEDGWRRGDTGYNSTSGKLQQALIAATRHLSLAGAVSALKKLAELPEEVPVYVASRFQNRLNDLVDRSVDRDAYRQLRDEEGRAFHATA